MWGARLPPACLAGGAVPPQSLLSSGAHWRQLNQPRQRESVPLRAVLCPGAGQRLASIECFLPKAPGQLRTLPGGQGVLHPQGLAFMCPEATRPSSMSGKAVILCERSRRAGLSCAGVAPGLLAALTTLLGVWIVSSRYPCGLAESHLGDQVGCKHRMRREHPGHDQPALCPLPWLLASDVRGLQGGL